MMADGVGALRISQLDANQLDQELLSLVRNQFNRIFPYDQTSLLTRLDPEITALIKFVIWRFSVFATGASIGQQILKLKYANMRRRDSNSPWMSRKQKLLHGFILIVLPWLKERFNITIDGLGFSGSSTQIKVNKYIEWAEKGLKLAALVNFAIFLQTGIYSSLTERVLGIRSMFPQRQSLRQVSFEFMTRELLWHAFSEFLFFLLPLVNFRRLKSSLSSYFLPRSNRRPTLPHMRTPADLTVCVICNQWPNNAHEIGCSHVFCYYCITSNFLADPSFVCPACQKNIPNEFMIRPVIDESSQR